MIEGLFLSLTAAELATMRTEWIACLHAIATANQSYSIAGRSFTRANLSEVRQMLAEITYAQSVQTGSLSRTVYSDMSG